MRNEDERDAGYRSQMASESNILCGDYVVVAVRGANVVQNTIFNLLCTL